MVFTQFRLVFRKSALNEGWSLHKLIILDKHTDILSMLESSCFCYEKKKLSWIDFLVLYLYQETVVIVYLENNKLQYQVSLNIIFGSVTEHPVQTVTLLERKCSPSQYYFFCKREQYPGEIISFSPSGSQVV